MIKRLGMVDSRDILLPKLVFGTREHGRITLNETEPCDLNASILAMASEGAFGSINNKCSNMAGVSSGFAYPLREHV